MVAGPPVPVEPVPGAEPVKEREPEAETPASKLVAKIVEMEDRAVAQGQKTAEELEEEEVEEPEADKLRKKLYEIWHEKGKRGRRESPRREAWGGTLRFARVKHESEREHRLL